jgi:hypothetical protein
MRSLGLHLAHVPVPAAQPVTAILHLKWFNESAQHYTVMEFEGRTWWKTAELPNVLQNIFGCEVKPWIEPKALQNEKVDGQEEEEGEEAEEG